MAVVHYGSASRTSGPDGNRTRDLLVANEARYRLRYKPVGAFKALRWMVLR